jgi:hypothetical protein
MFLKDHIFKSLTNSRRFFRVQCLDFERQCQLHHAHFEMKIVLPRCAFPCSPVVPLGITHAVACYPNAAIPSSIAAATGLEFSANLL